jgi:hypothetical protein
LPIPMKIARGARLGFGHDATDPASRITGFPGVCASGCRASDCHSHRGVRVRSAASAQLKRPLLWLAIVSYAAVGSWEPRWFTDRRFGAASLYSPTKPIRRQTQPRSQ